MIEEHINISSKNIFEPQTIPMLEIIDSIKDNKNLAELQYLLDSTIISKKNIILLLTTTFTSNYTEKLPLLKSLLSKSNDPSKIISDLVCKTPTIYFQIASECEIDLLNIILNKNNFISITDCENKNALFYALNSFSNRRNEAIQILIDSGKIF